MMLHHIKVCNLLSFGPEGVSLDLRPLNVLIGPNGSGKSNLIEAISLLQAAPNQLSRPVLGGGGIRDWIWKGSPESIAALEVVVDNPKGKIPVRHSIKFAESDQRIRLVDEEIANTEAYPEHRDKGPLFYYRFQNGRPVLSVKGEGHRELKREDVALDESILSQRKDPDQYAVITFLGSQYDDIWLYRNWEFGRSVSSREPQRADQRNDQLRERMQNLGLVLNRLGRDPKVKKSIVENLRQLYVGLDDYYILIEGGSVQVFLHESGISVPASRLSDGTLRYLCLLAVLCNPKPPPLVCIEEPELGLHPDILPTVARLLREASDRTQLIVTTHSDILVDEFTDDPEAVVVCEKSSGQTTMKRLNSNELAEWLKKYRLGELWTKGELGGVRW
jgi:predicted ATPase